MGTSGTVNGPTYKYTIGRDDLRVIAMGAHITKAIGLNTRASFAGAPEAPFIAGDFAMLEAEVNPVVKALRSRDIEVVAVHNHMIGEQPRMMFPHYLGPGPASTLAESFRAALDVLGKPQAHWRSHNRSASYKYQQSVRLLPSSGTSSSYKFPAEGMA